jgi:hypothetical protein
MASRRSGGPFTEKFYRYPDEVSGALAFIKQKVNVENVYYCPQLLVEPRRIKANVDLVQCVWADLDDCNPNNLLVRPTLVLETSPERYQAIWSLEQPIAAEDAEALSRRVAYGHRNVGSDVSGWDLTQLLRVPGTNNFKYTSDIPKVGIHHWDPSITSKPDDFIVYPQVEGYEYLDVPFPDLPARSGEQVLEDNKFKLNGAVLTLFYREAPEDRSKALYSLSMYCFEARLTMVETFLLCRDAQCNKFQGEDIRLWKDVCRARSKFEETRVTLSAPPTGEISILTEREWDLVESLPETYVDRYFEWAKHAGDAAEQYHIAGAFIQLSSVLTGSMVLPTSFGKLIPNLWFMILADTTLTRKSTAMDMAMDIVNDVDEDILMATDGSIEGLLTALSVRSGKPSVFLRDEFTGLIQQMTKKDYMAGMPELFTKLYDGKREKRLLRKEEIVIKDPRFIVFGGGIKSKTARLLNQEHVESGFLPRFIIVTAESDVSKVKPLGPPVENDLQGREALVQELRDIRDRHTKTVPISVAGKVVGVTNQIQEVTMTPEAWLRFNEFDQTMTQIALDTGEYAGLLVPTNARLSISTLKCAMLIAAARSQEGSLVIGVHDLLKALSYTDGWRRYSQDVVMSLGQSDSEHRIKLIQNAVEKKGTVSRSRLMQTYHMTAREMDDVEKTLVGRGVITKGGGGRATTYNSMLGEQEE